MSLLERALHELRVAEAVELLGIGKTLRFAREAARDAAFIRRQMGTVMSTLAELNDKIDRLVEDVNRATEELRAALDSIATGELSPGNQAAVDAMAAKLDDLDAAVEAVSPQPADESTESPAGDTPATPNA